jgi:hypothetical protein
VAATDDRAVARSAPVAIRTARPDDGPRLCAIGRSIGTTSGPDDRDDLLPHRLDLPHGDDYFCLVAEVDRHVVGYLSAGGSRDDDHKSYGELYELTVDPVLATTAVVELLARAGVDRMIEARYGGVLVWLRPEDAALVSVVVAAGFVPDDPARPPTGGHRGVDAGRRRYAMVL